VLDTNAMYVRVTINGNIKIDCSCRWKYDCGLFQMAFIQIKYTIDRGSAMTKSFIRGSAALRKKIALAFENGKKEMMAPVERM
jgi:hypothetical protein